MASKFNNYLSQEEKDIIISMYNEGYNTVVIANKLNRHNSSIGRFLKKQGLQTNNNKTGLTKTDKQNIIKYYQEGKTAKEILSLYENKVGTENTIMSIVKEVGINRPRGIVCDADVDYFETIDTEAKAYYLGLMLTDGNVHKIKRNTEQYRIQIALQSQDRDILERFKKELHSSNKIIHYQKDKRDECIFGIQSAKMAYDLSKQGITPNKTFIAELNYNIPPDLFRHYIRGIFDGDGTVYYSNKHLHFGFYGTHKLVTQVQDWLIEQINLTRHKITDKETVSFTTYQKRKDIENFYNLIYTDASFYLKRKKEKFNNYLNK